MGVDSDSARSRFASSNGSIQDRTSVRKMKKLKMLITVNNNNENNNTDADMVINNKYCIAGSCSATTNLPLLDSRARLNMLFHYKSLWIKNVNDA